MGRTGSVEYVKIKKLSGYRLTPKKWGFYKKPAPMHSISSKGKVIRKKKRSKFSTVLIS